ncbi:hypothetical protein TVAG_339910 [Trichomonas vaginalis G3]|uniref:MatE family protein n=1 Tax=Trichomonas vaginalis (strain ATCC PRA-98 / G3) TaxID=412133 RepID=A2F172_TRIV3|nr:multidrug resistance protein YPNP-related family [Trichomonas vaginalis G3]EAY01363.1 hypothetical protein TVAG_339910 [Trichomonas vaginalis G3]KAI5516665.1 multidrug resistance protein YPNP-related family [Trichomonas vaginalis G3]|eukprot:XP_001330216.1 hypothetical protein [Trichomonas vaginalis G3]
MEYESVQSISETSESVDEDKILGNPRVFLTSFRLNFPGFLFCLISATQDFLDLYFIKKGFDTRGVTIVSISSIVRNIVIGLGGFHSQGVTKKFSEYIAKKDYKSIGKLYVEALRFNLILGIILSSVLIGIIPSLIPSLGIPEEFKSDTLKYLLPIALFPTFVIHFLYSCSILLATGRAILAGALQIVALVTSLLMDPVFIYLFKAKISLMGIAFVSGPFIMSIILFFTFAFHVFENIKPNWHAFIEKPTSDFWHVIKSSFPLLTTISLGVVTPLVFTLLMKRAASKDTTEIVTVYSTSMKVFILMAATVAGGMSGVIPLAVFALHTKDKPRFVKVVLYSLILPGIVIVILCTIMVVKPFLIMQIWIHDPVMISYIPKISSIPFYTGFLVPITELFILLTIVMGYGGLAVVPPLVKATALFTSAIVFLKVAKNNAIALLYAYNFQDVFGLVGAGSVFLYCYIHTKKEYFSEFSVVSGKLLEEEAFIYMILTKTIIISVLIMIYFFKTVSELMVVVFIQQNLTMSNL